MKQRFFFVFFVSFVVKFFQNMIADPAVFGVG